MDPLERDLDDGRTVYLCMMLGGNWRICIGPTGELTFDDGWCFHDRSLAERAFAEWNGEGHPYGWFKHLGSQTYQYQFAREGTPPPYP